MKIASNGNVNVGRSTDYSTATKLYIKGTSTGVLQPIVRIEQVGLWDGPVNFTPT